MRLKIKYSNKLFEDQKFIEAEPLMRSFLKIKIPCIILNMVCVLFKYADKSKQFLSKKAIKMQMLTQELFLFG